MKNDSVRREAHESPAYGLVHARSSPPVNTGMYVPISSGIATLFATSVCLQAHLGSLELSNLQSAYACSILMLTTFAR